MLTALSQRFEWLSDVAASIASAAPGWPGRMPLQRAQRTARTPTVTPCHTAKSFSKERDHNVGRSREGVQDLDEELVALVDAPSLEVPLWSCDAKWTLTYPAVSPAEAAIAASDASMCKGHEIP